MAIFVVAACGGKSKSSESSSTTTSSGSPTVGVDDLTADFAAMKTLKPLASEGKGMIGVLLPDTTTSTRYVQYDAPNLKKAFETAGLTSSQFKIDNAHGSTSTMQQQAEADITAGASVLLIDPLDPGSGAAIESKAESQGVKVIDYDRLVTGGPEGSLLRQLQQRPGGAADRPGHGRLHRRLEGQQAADPRDERRRDGQQRQAVRAGLQRRARPEVRRRHVHEGRRAGRDVGCADRRDDVRAAVHRPPEHERGRDAKRRHRRTR